jgi:hypothetical protein
MRLPKRYIISAAVAVALGLTAYLFLGCEEDVAGTTKPLVTYRDQTFSLLVCDGNNGAEGSWDHDGAPVCTLDWNNDGSGPNRVPVVYVYNDYPRVDGVAEKLSETRGGDFWLWEKTPWTVIKTGPMIGKGSGIKEVRVKALYTYVNPPRIWFLFQWEDPSHTIQPPKTSGNDENPVGGTMHYYWYQKGGFEIPSDGFQDNRSWKSREDWLALVWSTWFVRNTTDPKKIPDPTKEYDWELVETVPGFQQKGIEVCKGTGDVVYRTPAVNTQNAPYNQVGYPGPYCDMWYFSASRTNYTSVGGWTDTEAAYLFDCFIDKDGFNYPQVGSNDNPLCLQEWLKFDSGIIGATWNGGERGLGVPGYQAPNDPQENPPGAYYLWSSEQTIEAFSNAAPWPKEGGARVAGYLNRPALGSAADVICRCTWEQPNRMFYVPWEGKKGERLKKNEYAKDWNYTLEMMREIGTLGKNDPTQDVLLGIFNPHPGE